MSLQCPEGDARGTRTLLILALSLLICFNIFFFSAILSNHHDNDLDGDLSFHKEKSSGSNGRDSYSPPPIDEKDVVVLRESNFSDFVLKNRYVMVEFYAPWCVHCQALAPEYAAAATELNGEALLAKVDATEEYKLAQKYKIAGYPTMFFFIHGVHNPYSGQRTKDAIVTWVKKKTCPSIDNVTTIEEAERILTAGSKIVLGFLDALVGPESKELAAASVLEDDVNFYQTASPDVAKLFHINPHSKRPTLVLVKKEAEKISHFNSQFTKSAIAEFVFENKIPLVTIFTRESAPLIFENPIKKQEAAKAFKGKLLFVYVEKDSGDVGQLESEYFGAAVDAPRVLAYTGNDDAKKFVLDGELTLSSIKSFGENFLEGKLKPFYKSDPIPEKNDGDVKVVVGNNFDEIVLDESEDVLLEIYAPWCGHCQSLEPIYNKLAKHVRGIDSLVIAKMDGTTNKHPRAKADGFPTLLFFPAGNKSFDPITVDTDHTVVAFYEFLKKHAVALTTKHTQENNNMLQAASSH
ncbi:protein disulfide isomerase-like 1-4 isoform X2 [Cornus florida]|uniref:protein disulfide isomerase-like 1-4 isoform X2 n=1 Tax=Cornus florida TaxID=4283 RepID=UPI00289FDCF5|nr:protein disulfide isomerase-like 1-4 isoform X2 [Cornus florida]